MNAVIPVEKRHLHTVDYIRAFASLAVAIFHLGGKALPVLRYGWLGVEMFFVLSGFIICWSVPPGYTFRDSGRFIWKRIIRIEPPYLFSIALIIFLNRLNKDASPPDWTNVFLHLGYLNGYVDRPYLNPVYWTLGLEFQFYIFVALTLPLITGRAGGWLITCLCLVPFVAPVAAQTLISFFPLFALGILTFLFRSNYLKLVPYIGCTAIAFILSGQLMGWLPSAAGLGVALLLLIQLPPNKLVGFFSKISFSLYLTHDIIGSRAVIFLGTFFPRTIFYKGLFFITGIVISIIFAYFYYLIIEKPFYLWSKTIKYRPKEHVTKINQVS